MNILFFVKDDIGRDVENQLNAALRQALPGASLRVWPETGELSDINYAVVWGPPPEFFDGLTNLKAILSVAAGVDHLLDHPGLPTGVPLVRLLDAGMGEKMAEYVLYGVLQAHRQMHRYKQFQQQRVWSELLPSKPANDVEVGLLGMGTLGQQVANRLALNGYSVSGWSRSEKNIERIKTYHGNDGLDNMLKHTDVLVCLLPLTQQTHGFLNQQLFDRLRPGVFLINVARGGHLVDKDLLLAIENGQLSGALLDVTTPEPLPEQHAFWDHPLITVTPHISAPTQTHESVVQLVSNLKKHQQGLPMSGIVDRTSGY